MVRHERDPAGTWEVATALPAARLRSLVVRYRGFSFDLSAPRRRLELPDCMATLVILFGQKLRVHDVTREEPAAACSFTSLVSGPQSRARLGEHDGRLRGVEIVIAPWAAYTFFGTPMDQLANSLTEPADLLGTRFHALDDRLDSCPDWPGRFALLDTVLTHWLEGAPAVSARVLWAWNRLSETSGGVPVHLLARECGWSERHLERCFEHQIGLLPKTASRILRMRGALRLVTDGLPGAIAASLSGYSDQSHLSREFKSMTGWTMSRFLRARATGRTGPPDVDRVEGQPTSLVLPD
ncbi:helix-turn-helix domain-containing protein [Streptomyces sp. NPDC018029]|uniref:helix-turn-helix domain-containing protein n=1 Tax=Streptomyces sp. NPDC018029 TaxID=3365032 RepID=UPI003788DDE8